MPILMILLLLLLVLVLGFFVGGTLLSTRPYRGPQTDHFNGKRFKNPSGVSAKGFDAVFKYLKNRDPDTWTVNNDPINFDGNLNEAISDKFQYTFVNHSTFLIQHLGINLLTDPIWSQRCSPFQFIGPKRMRPPGMDLTDLPEIHLVLITHNHYDHLDKNTVRHLIKTYDPDFVVPLGLAHLITQWGGRVIAELDWYESIDYNGITVTATPCNHFSSRGIRDRNTSLWCGYTLISDKISVYYVGDTGYSSVFKEICDRLGPFDLSFIPIGAFKPKWFMGPIHVSPSQAVQIHRDVKSKQSIAMHFGTFPLADDNRETDLSLLELALSEAKITSDTFKVPVEGKVEVFRNKD